MLGVDVPGVLPIGMSAPLIKHESDSPSAVEDRLSPVETAPYYHRYGQELMMWEG
jgi:hypothetical protein